MSKAMTASALMMLVDEGKVNVDDPVEKYLPDFHGQMVAAEQDQEHETDEHDDAGDGALPAGTTQVLEMRLVIASAVQLFHPESRWMAESLKVPCPFAVAPGSNLRSGNEAIVAHERYRLLRLPHSDRVVRRLTNSLAEIAQPSTRISAVHHAADEA